MSSAWWYPISRYLPGIRFGTWLRLLRQVRFSIDPPYLPRAAFTTIASVVNSFLARVEERLYGDAIRRTSITTPPVFILGHWRSGTTHLFNLLAQDVDNFAYPTTYEAVCPHTFLCTERLLSVPISWFMPRRRPMDGVELGPGTPNEDEFALAVTTLLSPFLGIVFPRDDEVFAPSLTLRSLPPEKVELWKRTLLWYCRKLTFKHGRRLLLKSPPHTARVRLLLDVFPDARFIHIRRHPYDVFRSYRHYFRTAPLYSRLQDAAADPIEERILARYQDLYDAYFEDLSRVPPGRITEIAFEDLDKRPVEEIKRAYRELELPGFERLRPALDKGMRAYRKNEHEELPEALKRRIAERWRRSFAAWDYRP